MNNKFYVKAKNKKRLDKVLKKAEEYGYKWRSNANPTKYHPPYNRLLILFDTAIHKIVFQSLASDRDGYTCIKYKDFLIIDEMREKLTEHCADKSCKFSGCVLNKSDCRCGRGASFQTKKSDGTYKMSELEIVDAYYKVFPKEDTEKSIEEKSEFLEKFEDGKEYIFDKSTFYKYEKEEQGDFNEYLWADIIDNGRVEVLDSYGGIVGSSGYRVSPPWCIESKTESKEKKQITDKDCFEWLLDNYFNGPVMFNCFEEDLNISGLQRLGINKVVEKIKNHLESEGE